MQLEIGSSASPHSQYSGSLYTISWQTEAGTIYGGTLNVTTGTLTVTHALMDVSAATWAYITSYAYPVFRAAIPGAARAAGEISVLCSKYEPSTNRTYTAFRGADLDGKICVVTDQSQPWIALQDAALTSLDAFAAAASDLQIVYRLAEPLTVSLTPAEVRTLLGANVLSADTGAVSVRYVAHPAEPTADGNYALICAVSGANRSFRWEAQA